MTKQKTDSERLNEVRERLTMRNERITKEFLKQMNGVCEYGLLESANAFDNLFNEFIRFGKTMEHIKELKERVKETQGIDEVLKEDIEDLPTYIDTDYIEMIESDLYIVRKVINAILWYLPQKNTLEIIETNLEH